MFINKKNEREPRYFQLTEVSKDEPECNTTTLYFTIFSVQIYNSDYEAKIFTRYSVICL